MSPSWRSLQKTARNRTCVFTGQVTSCLKMSTTSYVTDLITWNWINMGTIRILCSEFLDPVKTRTWLSCLKYNVSNRSICLPTKMTEKSKWPGKCLDVRIHPSKMRGGTPWLLKTFCSFVTTMVFCRWKFLSDRTINQSL